MIRRSFGTGIIAGLILSIASIYPVLALIAPFALDEWERPIQSPLLDGIILMLAAALFVPTFLGAGFIAARRSEAVGWLEGAKSGVLTGLVAGCIVAIMVLIPLNTLEAYQPILLEFEQGSRITLPDEEDVADTVDLLEQSTLVVDISVILHVVVMGAQGTYMGWRRRDVDNRQPDTLIELVKQGINPQVWFAKNESSLQIGLLVGLAISVLVIRPTFGELYIDLLDSPELNQLMRFVTGNAMDDSPEALSFLTPLLTISLLGFGGLVVGLTRNPKTRFRGRIAGVMLAGVIISASLFASIAQGIYLTWGLIPYVWFRNVGNGDINPPLELLFDGTYYIIGAFGIAWSLLLISVIVGVVVGLAQGLFYSIFVPLIRPRPVDVAFGIHYRLIRKPQDVVPIFYQLYRQHERAHHVLAHLAGRIYRRDKDTALITSAFHALSHSKDIHSQIEATETIQEVLGKHPEWRWAMDTQAVYTTLRDVLTARTLEQILQITEPPTQSTSSLPPLLGKSMQYINQILSELQKMERVEDLSTKLIFLENGLEAIHNAQRFVTVEMSNPAIVKSRLPAHMVLVNALDHWQGIVLKAIKQLKGRADVSCLLKTKQIMLSEQARQLPLVFELSNTGLNVAQGVRVRVLPGREFTFINDQTTAEIEILPPAEIKQGTIPIQPNADARRIRIEWEVIYDDAVDAERKLLFADVIEAITPDKPFTRIFPIPYVTGTPLKTDHVFVGRQDVFEFIRENMVGMHQNNIIILHGQRRTGKTSVLYRLGEMMSDTHYGVLIDMQGKPARSEVDLLYAIADDIIFALEDHNVFANLPPRSAFEDAPEFFFRSRFLRNIYPHLEGKNILLMFDEFEELQRRVEDGYIEPSFFHFLRNLMQHEKHLDFVFSGTHKLEELGAEYWSILFNIAAYKPITFLSDNEVHRLITEPVAQYNVEYDPLAIERIRDVAAGHPYFTQLILHEMIVYHNETKRSYLTVTDVEQVLERIVERGEAHFKYIWAESTEEERLVLRAMTELLVSSETAPVARLREFLTERGYESLTQWAIPLLSLESRDILTRTSPKSQRYRFMVDLIRLWVDATRPGL